MGLFTRHEKLSKIVLFRNPAFDRKGLRREYQDLLHRYGATRIEPLHLVNGAVCNFSFESHLQALGEEEEVASLEENLRVKLYPVRVLPSNIFFKQQSNQIIPWVIHRIGADQLWPLTTGESIKVAVLDTGIDLYHPDLQENIAGGVNFVEPHLPPQDDHGHGSHVSGTIAAVKNNYGIVGAAPRAKIYAVKVLNHNGEGYFADVIKALEWCLERGIQVINLSFGSNISSQALHKAICQVTARGIIVVAAAGNDGTTQSVDYPAAYPEVVAVGAVDEQSKLTPFSSKGLQLKIVAPGTRILSTGTGGIFQRLSGTSMATSHVTGALALLLALVPRLKAERVLRLMYHTAEKLPSLSNKEQGAGLVRVDLAGKALHTPLEKHDEEHAEVTPEEGPKPANHSPAIPWPFPFRPPPKKKQG